jgi:hypothetical protein
MSRYTLELLWPNEINTMHERRRSLASQDMQRAKIEAALVFAEPFRGQPPSA